MAKFCLTSFNFKQLDFAPDKIAVSGIDQSLSWAELYQLCNVIKKELIHADANHNKVVVGPKPGVGQGVGLYAGRFRAGFMFCTTG